MKYVLICNDFFLISSIACYVKKIVQIKYYDKTYKNSVIIRNMKHNMLALFISVS